MNGIFFSGITLYFYENIFLSRKKWFQVTCLFIIYYILFYFEQVIGAPIPVTKVSEPTEQQVDDLLSVYIDKLTELYETHGKVHTLLLFF
jgi:hypothetical protein